MQRVVELIHKGRSTINLYPDNTGEVGPRLRDSEGVVWWWGERGSILRFLSGLLLGKMPYWDGILTKRGKQRGRTTQCMP